MDELHASLFGKVSVWRGNRSIDALLATKAQELLAYLLLHRNQVHARETLAERLWSDHPSAQSKKYLRQALWKLRAALDDHSAPPEEHLLQLQDEWIQVRAHDGLQLDIATFEQTYIVTHGIPGEALDDRSALKLIDAVDLYHGDLLDGWYNDWCIYERERFQSMLLSMLDKLMGYCETRGNYERGIHYGVTILRHDRAREQTHRKLMRLNYLSGDRTGALRQFNLCVAALAEELDVPPAKRTLALYEAIRADQLDGLSQDAPLDRPESERLSTQFAGMLSRFDLFETMLAESQREIQQQIHSIETALDRAAKT